MEPVIVTFIVFAMPVAIVWLTKHYKALEKGHLSRGGLGEGSRVKQLEAQNQDLLERVQNLESIVVGLDEAPSHKALAGKRPQDET